MPSAGSDDQTSKLAMLIEEQIRSAFLTRSWRVFVPEQFTSLAPLAQVVDVLVELAARGKLVGEASYRCNEGHDYGSMRLDEVDVARAPACTVCADPDLDEDPRVALRFTIADEWAELMSASKKKASLPSPPTY